MRLLLILLMLSGCASNKTVPIVEVIETQTIHPSKPDPITMLEVKWKIHYINGVAYYGLTTKHYENLSKNMSEIIRYITQQNEIIIFYRTE